MTTIAQALASAKQLLTASLAYSDSARLDAELLLCHVLGQSRSYLLTWPERELSAEQLAAFTELLGKRATHQPIAYLIGHRDFWDLTLKVSPATLIPRPDTEVLVEQALLRLPAQGRVLDLGTGTGAIALAIKSARADVTVIGIDKQADAVALAQQNAELNRLDVQFLQSDWFSAVASQHFDVIVSNPPYIDAQDPHLTQGDVAYEPRTALVAAENGLADISTIIAQALPYLADSWLLFEHGYQQADAVQQRLLTAGFEQVQTVTDYAGQPRVTLGYFASR